MFLSLVHAEQNVTIIFINLVTKTFAKIKRFRPIGSVFSFASAVQPSRLSRLQMPLVSFCYTNFNK